MIKIPNNKKFSLVNRSDVVGNIFRTKNIDFDEYGKIKLAARTSVIAESVGESNLLASSGHYIHPPISADNTVLIGGSDKLYYSDFTDEFPTFTQDTSTSTPTLNSSANNDMCIWDNDYYVANNANILKNGGNFPNSTWSTFSTENAAILEPFTNLNQIAACTGDNEVKTFNTSGVEVQTLTIPSDYDISGMIYNNERLFISTGIPRGCKHSLVLEWDGLSTSSNDGTIIENAGILAMTSYREGVVVLTDDGRLIYVRGGAQTLAYFPIYYTNDFWDLTSGFPTYNAGRVSRDAIEVKGNKIYISIDSAHGKGSSSMEIRKRYSTDFPSGVWCYDPEVGLYHKYSIGQSKMIREDFDTTDVDTSTDIVTVSNSTVPETGTACLYKNSYNDAQTSVGGLTSGQKYFVIKESSTTFKFATTKANALADAAIDLTGTGNNAQYVVFLPTYDFGGIAAGAKSFRRMTNIYNDLTDETLFSDGFVTGKFIQDASTTQATGVSVIHKNVENRGYIITPKIESNFLKDVFKSIIVKFTKMKNPEDKIVVKYRTSETDLNNFISVNTPNAVFTDEHTFTSTDDLSGVVAGDEVEVVDGAGAGYLAHVSSIAEDGGTYTVNIDEDISNLTANDISYVVFQNWTKLGSVDVDSEENIDAYKTFRINKKAKWIQFKIELRGIETTIEELIINNETVKPVV